MDARSLHLMEGWNRNLFRCLMGALGWRGGGGGWRRGSGGVWPFVVLCRMGVILNLQLGKKPRGFLALFQTLLRLEDIFAKASRCPDPPPLVIHDLDDIDRFVLYPLLENPPFRECLHAREQISYLPDSMYNGHLYSIFLGRTSPPVPRICAFGIR